MSGNAIRCVGKYLYDKVIVAKETMEIETLSGVKTVTLHKFDGEVKEATVNIGKAEFDPAKLPARFEGDSIVDRPLVIGDKEYQVTCVSVGNPHVVTFCKNPDSLDLNQIGPLFEEHEMFPERVNAEFVRVVDDHTLKMRVWERGIGETLSCGTGACAAAIAAVANGFCKKGEDITVRLKGGSLVIRYTDEAVYLRGDASIAYEGIVQL